MDEDIGCSVSVTNSAKISPTRKEMLDIFCVGMIEYILGLYGLNI